MARMQAKYKEIVAGMMKELSIENPMAAPKLKKIVISMGIGDLAKEKTKIADLQEQLSKIAGQKVIIKNARKSISNFNLREGMPVGLKVTLRRDRMYEFFDRLVSIAIPRIRDFRGLNPSAFDGSGNYNMGLTEQSVFPEVDPAKISFVHGMNVSINTSAENDVQGLELLKRLGMPFKDVNNNDN